MNRIHSFTKQQKLLAGIVILIILLVGIRMAGSASSEKPSEEERTIPVTLFNIHDNKELASIPSTGKIEALSNVDVKAQISEKVTSVPVSIGDAVWPGAILATLNSADILAQTNLAEANLNAAQASLEGLQTGARQEQLDVTTSQVQSAQIAYNNAKNTAVNTVQNTYITINDTVTNKTDVMFRNPHVESRELLFTTYDYQSKIDIKETRGKLETMLNKDASYDDIYLTLEQAQTDANTVIQYLNLLSSEVNKLSASGNISQATVDGWKVIVSVARSTMNGVLTGLYGAEEKLSLAESSLSTAKKQLTLVEAGASINQLEAQEAGVQAAQANLNVAYLQLAKSSIKSPISGTVSNTFVKVGDLVSPGQTIATVVNTSGLKITAFVNERDISLISIGASVYIDSKHVGNVSRIAPSINPQTKKVEVEIAIDKDYSESFVVGQFVSIDIAIASNLTTLPLSAIKTTTDGQYIFIVTDNTATRLPVTVERIFGDFVYIQESLSDITGVIEDARGINEGDTVTTLQ